MLMLAAPFVVLACSPLIGLADLDKSDCVACASASGSSTGGAAGTPSSSGALSGGSLSSAGNSSSAGGSAGSSPSGGASGSLSVAGAPMQFPIGGDGSEGLGGAAPDLEPCPGGPEPPLTWKEHWYEHTEDLTRVYYDACIAMYFDGDVTPEVKDWLIPFLDAAWSYSITTYGDFGGGRLYVVVHQGKFEGGHSAIIGEPSHDNRNVIDMGATAWAPGDYDLPAHLLGFIVDYAGAHPKLGAPKAEHYGNAGFPLIYKYDLYVALGLTNVASAALDYFNTVSNDQPYPDTFWFRDWFYPLWRDHGHAEIFKSYQSLLKEQYPIDADDWMPTANYGQYFHFMSGAANQDLESLARGAFEWHPDFDEEISSAKEDFPDITY
jgi:hypothetical protein